MNCKVKNKGNNQLDDNKYTRDLNKGRNTKVRVYIYTIFTVVHTETF